VGSSDHPAVARVEIPLWVMEVPDSIDLLHSVLLDQARQSGLHPYPYALIRAHETAVVKMDEHEALTGLIQNELLRRGVPLQTDSEKLANKKVGTRTRY
jgi:NurA-like 5'-3' nuclease